MWRTYTNRGGIMKFDFLNDKEFSEILDKSYAEVMFELKDKDKYKEAYNILMEYWDCLPDEEKPSVDKRLKEIGL